MRFLSSWFFGALIFAIGGLSTVATQAAWPAKVFAPYMYLGSSDNFKLTECDDACGQKYYTLAFIIAGGTLGKDAKSADSTTEPTWYGRVPLAQNFYADQIDAIRQRGGDVIVSFGGEGGKELGLVIDDVAALQAKYQAVVDQYHFTWLDFDIEGKALDNAEANQRRNAALAALQAKNPGIKISFTLPVDPNGISRSSRSMLSDAAAKGLKVYSANVMTMYFGPQFVKDKKLCDVCIASAEKAYEQCQAIDKNIKIGLTPMIGRGGDKGAEVFTIDDAKTLEKWAADKPWVCSLSFWCSNRDSGKPSKKSNGNTASGVEQEPWDYSKAFQAFIAK